MRKTSSSASETSLVNAALTFLRTQGAWAARMNTGAASFGAPGQRRRFVRFGTPGLSDIVALYHGAAFFIECKRSPNRPTEQQETFLREVEAHGAVAWVIYSVAELAAKWQERFGSVQGKWT